MAQKVFIVGGGGMVGASAAYALALQEIVNDIVLIDVNEQAAWGQAADIDDALALGGGVSVRSGSYDEIEDDDIVVITGGAAQKPGQSRLDLVGVNTKIIEDIVDQIMQNAQRPYILMVTNPVDVLTYVALKKSGLPKNRVFGTGTTLDTFRLRVKLAELLDVSDDEISAYVLGEHGDSSVTALSGARAGDVPIANLVRYDAHAIENISDEIKNRVYKIIDSKKSTYFAIGQVVAQIVDALRQEHASIFPVCSLAEGEYGLNDVVVGLPSRVSQAGVEILPGYDIGADEKEKLAASAAVVRDAIDSTKS